MVAPESGVYRATGHPYQLFFVFKTKVEKCEDNTIDKIGLSLSTIRDVCGYGPDHEFLVG
jgi:hypothetical protein